MLVIGAPNSSNSLRLAEVGERLGVPARLIQRADDIDFNWLGMPAVLGLTAGASAPEVLVREVVERLQTRFAVTEDEVKTAEEHMIFKLPRQLTA
jgi:4-hydroxy-3-methylbut-2-en-1-yl diphosphate reductase